MKVVTVEIEEEVYERIIKRYDKEVGYYYTKNNRMLREIPLRKYYGKLIKEGMDAYNGVNKRTKEKI